MNQTNQTNQPMKTDGMDKTINKKQKEWWGQIRKLTNIRRNRALTNRCKICGRGTLQGVKITFPKGEIEAFCDECKVINKR